MGRKRKKSNKIKPRAYVVELMLLHCKPGSHGDARKETSRKACRKFRRALKERNYEC